MSDLQPDSVPAQEQQGQPSQTASQNEVAPNSRLNDVDLEAVSQVVTSILDERDRKSQSNKDKGVAQANKTSQLALDEIGKVKELLSNRGLLSTEISQELDNQESATIREIVTSLVNDRDGSGQESGQVDFVNAFANAGYNTAQLSQDDYQFALSFEGGQVELQNALLERRLGNQQPAPTGAAVVQPSGGGAQPLNKEGLTQQYLDELGAAAGQGYAAGDAVKQKYRDLGVDVDNIIVMPQ